MNNSPIISTRALNDAKSLDLSEFPPIIQRLYRARGIRSRADVDYSLSRMLPPNLKGMDGAVERIATAIMQNQTILIAGDFDTDGATSTAMVMRMLSKMGATALHYIVPNRFEYGYGLSRALVEDALIYKPNLIITVDNGVSSVEGVAYAQSLGIDVVVTDHHLPPDELPPAYAIVNPNLMGDEFPSKTLAGVGVAFYVMVALRAYLRKAHWFDQNNITEPDLREILDLVALGTVADVVPFDTNNRLLVTQGMQRIRAGKACEGIKALFKLAKREPECMQASDLGFAIAPRLNAAGRLDDMSVGIECLLTDNAQIAEELAESLDAINQDRRAIEAQMKNEAFLALGQLEKTLAKRKDKLPSGLCVYQSDWHSGVVGILAARIKEQYNRPVIVFADDSDDFLKGSARSIEGVHIKDVLEYIDSHNLGLITKFGGHAMAAGLTLQKDKLKKFETLFAERVDTLIGERLGQKIFETDGELDASEMTLLVADQIQQAGPWGQGFPEPTFYGEFSLLDKRVLKEAHLKMIVEHEGVQLDAIAFNQTGDALPAVLPTRVKLVYKLAVNVFKGRRSVQLMVDYVAPV